MAACTHRSDVLVNESPLSQEAKCALHSDEVSAMTDHRAYRNGTETLTSAKEVEYVRI